MELSGAKHPVRARSPPPLKWNCFSTKHLHHFLLWIFSSVSPSQLLQIHAVAMAAACVEVWKCRKADSVLLPPSPSVGVSAPAFRLRASLQLSTEPER